MIDVRLVPAATQKAAALACDNLHHSRRGGGTFKVAVVTPGGLSSI
jgi:hypothetical protein